MDLYFKIHSSHVTLILALIPLFTACFSSYQVEMFLIRAVGLKLLEGKIDQVKATVSINRCTMRTFGSKEWVAVRAKIGAWRDQLVAVQASLVVYKGGGSAVQGTPSVKSQPAIKA
jgi:hypothetical protein